jgi:hypothetical protein
MTTSLIAHFCSHSGQQRAVRWLLMTDDDWCSWARRGSGGGAMAAARAWAHGACESETERKKRAEESAARRDVR